jgi:hypothetical protein
MPPTGFYMLSSHRSQASRRFGHSKRTSFVDVTASVNIAPGKNAETKKSIKKIMCITNYRPWQLPSAI